MIFAYVYFFLCPTPHSFHQVVRQAGKTVAYMQIQWISAVTSSILH